MQFAFIIFGSTGDLCFRKLIPALYNLYKNNLIKNFNIICLGRGDYTTKEYIRLVAKKIKNISLDEEFCKLLSYYKIDILNENDYNELNNFLFSKTVNNNRNYIYYFAVAADYYNLIISNLNKITSYNSRKIIIEKPFGKDMDDFIKNYNILAKFYNKENIYFLDHYLGKEMVQNIFYLKNYNSLIENILNKDFVESIEICSKEVLGIENRGNFYENTGAMKDMIQNHLLQILILLTMDLPKIYNKENFINEKLKLIKKFMKWDEKLIKDNIVRAQYIANEELNISGYQNEKNVDSNSNTETFVGLKLFIENNRWRNIPIYISTGKRMDKVQTVINIKFKNEMFANKIIINIQPEMNIKLILNLKVSGFKNTYEEKILDLPLINNNVVEAYEKLILDAINNDGSLYTSFEEIIALWEYTKDIYINWQNNKSIILKYRANSKCIPEFESMKNN